MDDHFLAYDFNAMMVVARYALVRVGEMTMSPKVANHCLFWCFGTEERNSHNVLDI